MKTVEELEKEINNVEEVLNNLKTKVEELKKSKIPLATKYFLESLNNKYKWIAKDENGQVWAYDMKPKKRQGS